MQSTSQLRLHMLRELPTSVPIICVGAKASTDESDMPEALNNALGTNMPSKIGAFYLTLTPHILSLERQSAFMSVVMSRLLCLIRVLGYYLECPKFEAMRS